MKTTLKLYLSLTIAILLINPALGAIKDPIGIADEIAARSSTPAEESITRIYDADNNAKAFSKKALHLHSNNGKAYRLFGDITVITAGNDDGTLDSLEDKIREATGSALLMMKNCSNCDIIGTDTWLADFKPGGSLFGHSVRFLSKYDATYGVAYRVDPGTNNAKKIIGFEANLTNFSLGKGNNGKVYGFRFDPVILAVVFYENIGTANEVKTGEIKMTAAPTPPPASSVNCKKKTGLINCR